MPTSIAPVVPNVSVTVSITGYVMIKLEAKEAILTGTRSNKEAVDSCDFEFTAPPQTKFESDEQMKEFKKTLEDEIEKIFKDNILAKPNERISLTGETIKGITGSGDKKINDVNLEELIGRVKNKLIEEQRLTKQGKELFFSEGAATAEHKQAGTLQNIRNMGWTVDDHQPDGEPGPSSEQSDKGPTTPQGPKFR